jgi:hypothetical protein
MSPTPAIVLLLAAILIELAIFAIQVKGALGRIESKLDTISKAKQNRD